MNKAFNFSFYSFNYIIIFKFRKLIMLLSI